MIESGILAKLDMGISEQMALSLANALDALPAMHEKLREKARCLKTLSTFIMLERASAKL